MSSKQLYERLVGKMMGHWVSLWPVQEWVDPEGAAARMAGEITRLRHAMGNMVRVIETDDVPGYIYDDHQAECVGCDAKALTIEQIVHSADCFQGALEIARAALDRGGR